MILSILFLSKFKKSLKHTQNVECFLIRLYFIKLDLIYLNIYWWYRGIIGCYNLQNVFNENG
ncbi:hypothetical protein BpHYR1_003524 [Brachionus plicatilis]|uniref:Uncharacterized protein n=1 Tax=Brachionus plicatilis TaxID=10195 RepID=A0A3M7RV50_BRAPC|nr:hypothetical protein BpHYR1_003524 [Brachionus plicatilis]